LGGALQSIETEVRNAKEVLDQVGQFSGQAHVPSVTVPLYEVVESALRNVEGALMRNNIKIIREISSDLAVKCDIDDFKTALTAIFKNAIESMENSLRKNLFIRANKVNNLIVFEIEDTGEGISSENLEKVMDPFYTTRSTLDHCGLGLSMVSGILRQHSAQLQLKSKAGDGTTVIIKLPTSQEVVQTLASCIVARTPKFEMAANPATVDVNASLPTEINAASENELFKSLNLFDDEDSIGDFQFGRLEFSEETDPSQQEELSLSLGEKAAQEVIQEIMSSTLTTSLTSLDEEPTISPSLKLKKKDESLSKIKVQIPRPEEKL
jgi:hypothetical protein